MLQKISFILALVAATSIHGQEVLVNEDPAADTSLTENGPNRKHYFHSFVGFGIAADRGDKGAGVVFPHLDQLVLGLRYKRRLSNYFAVGYDLTYSVLKYKLKQDSSKTVPDTALHLKQRMNFQNLQAGIYFRINFDKRGNRLGNYIDAGAYLDAVISYTDFIKFRMPDESVIKQRRNNLSYFQRFNYGCVVRIGINKVIVFGQYRISDMFYHSYNFAELPRLTVGVQFVL